MGFFIYLCYEQLKDIDIMNLEIDLKIRISERYLIDEASPNEATPTATIQSLPSDEEELVCVLYTTGVVDYIPQDIIEELKPPKFYQAKLVEVKDVIKEEYPLHHDQITITERMGSEEAICPECGKNHWWLLPKECVAVREGGKSYIECLNCGYQTHL